MFNQRNSKIDDNKYSYLNNKQKTNTFIEKNKFVENTNTNTNTDNTDSTNTNIDNVYMSNPFLYLDESEVSRYNQYIKKSPNKLKYKNIYCVNCGEKGHVVKDCNGPITSFGIISFKIVESEKDEMYDKNNKLQEILSTVAINNSKKYPKTKFLMIQRKDTMGFTDFVRGKYSEDENELKNILPIFLNEMTYIEKNNLLTKSFDEIWKTLWVNHDSKCFKNEYEFAYRRFQKLNIPQLIKESQSSFGFQEFGFPKGRRNMKETNIACAEREFFEETGYDKSCYDFIKNYPTIQEEFIGTNGVKYRHIYYLVKMKDRVPPPKIDYKNKIQTGEVQNIGWFSYEECMSIIRPYDTAKKRVVKKVYDDLLEMKNEYVCSNFYYTNRKSYHRSSPKKIPYKSSNYINNFRSNTL
jgi:8-oxo-dGTP pyrophosphatase MutT (NUDIX family)